MRTSLSIVIAALLVLLPVAGHAQTYWYNTPYPGQGPGGVATNATCNAAATGATRYSSVATALEYCNGTAWTVLAAGANTIDALTDAFTDYATQHNVIMGRTAAAALIAGAQWNTFLGEGAGATTANSTSATDENTAVGYNALASLTTGNVNTAVGASALNNVTTGAGNVGVGTAALLLISTNSYSTAVGQAALQFNTAGYNTAVGYGAGAGSAGSSTGDSNVLIGFSAGAALTTGSSNVAVGDSALFSALTGANNTAIGHFALKLNTNSDNTAVGSNALDNTTSGSDNTAVGSGALSANNTGRYNSALGYQALFSNTTKEGSTAVGYWAMRYADSAAGGAITYNTALGAFALQGSATAANNTGTNNTALGHSTLAALTSGGSNVAVGALTGDTLTTGGTNILIGYNIDTPANNTSNHLNIGGTIYGDVSTDNVRIGGSGAVSAGPFIANPPATETVGIGATITANACGTIKPIDATANRTTNTTDTFTAPTASYAGCCMDVVNVDTADTITLDANTKFKTIGGADQALGPDDTVRVCSNGTNWYQVGAVAGNQ